MKSDLGWIKTGAAPAPRPSVGSYVFAVAGLATGIVTLVWHDAHHAPYAVYAAAVAQVAGGGAMLVRPIARIGAAILGAGYLVFALLTLPEIFTAPKSYTSWGDFFEQFSLATGAAMAYAALWSSPVPRNAARIGRVAFGICVVSFTLEQAFYLAPTASLVPAWLPPGQRFWAVATTVAFALAAVALLVNRKALLATRLLTAMLVSFGLLVWVPLLIANPRSQESLSETAETFAIAGAAWILSELLARAEAPARA